MSLDPRITPARPDLAAAYLRDQVVADRFVEGARYQVIAARTALRQAPAPDGEWASELLFGETFDVYETREGWAWGQATRDGQVGYAAEIELSRETFAPTHKVIAPRALVFPGASLKVPIIGQVPMGARITLADQRRGFVHVPDLGWIAEVAVSALDQVAPDAVEIAERMVETPYLWGGRTAFGCDCSGLVQTAFEAAGRLLPRDSDQQAAALPLADGAPQRGDVLVWPGHIGLLVDADHLLHANAHHMACVIEPLAETLVRFNAKGLPLPVRHRAA